LPSIIDLILVIAYLLVLNIGHQLLHVDILYQLKIFKPPLFQKEIPKEVVEKPPTVPAFRAAMVLGIDIGYSAAQSESRTVYGTIMVDGLKPDENAFAQIDWGDNYLDEVPLQNGRNYKAHTFSSPGDKVVKCKILINGELRWEIPNRIKILGGR
jgi:hypothetical protein